MKNISKFKIEKSILIPILIISIISILSIYSATSLLDSDLNNIWIKQIIWYLIGFSLAYFVMFLGNKFLFQNAWILYIIGLVLLILVLIFGSEVNNAKCWFILGPISFQPSEFMKVFLIILISKLTNDFNEQYNEPSLVEEFKFLMKILIIVFIPSVLTFIEPDTGAVVIYLIITLSILFIGGIRKRWFILTFLTIFLIVGAIISIYILNQELFIKIFGTTFFYRMDRIFNWSNSSGMQLTNSLIAIGSAGTFGHGFNNTPIYFPEMQTDFIFAVFTSNFGFIGALIFIGIIIFFDISLIVTEGKTANLGNKYALGGILGILFFQQIYNISMTIGLLPIMGITLPFMSYGGSSLLSYMILLGMIFSISNENLRYTN